MKDTKDLTQLEKFYQLLFTLTKIAPSTIEELWKRDIKSFSPREIEIIENLRIVLPDIKGILGITELVDALDETYEEARQHPDILKEKRGR